MAPSQTGHRRLFAARIPQSLLTIATLLKRQRDRPQLIDVNPDVKFPRKPAILRRPCGGVNRMSSRLGRVSNQAREYH
jgi:hypothetical protein